MMHARFLYKIDGKALITCFTVVIGGFRFGMMIALPYCLAECGTSDWSAAPSRRWRCQSSGFVIVKREGDLLAIDIELP